MQALDPIETILARLMPPALSQDCQHDIDTMLDELAAPLAENGVASPSGKTLPRWLLGGGIAAAVAGLLAVFAFQRDTPKSDTIASAPASPDFVLVSGSDRIESVTDEGQHENFDGSAMHALRLSAVEENNVRDQQSGMVVQISARRDEFLFTPVTSF
jgi:hypothetical protein